MIQSLLLDPVRGLLLAAMVFIPFERLASEQPAQPIFRKGWTTDLFTALLNGWVTFALLLLLLSAIDRASTAVIPGLRVWLNARAVWIQIIIAIAIGDLGIYLIHRLSHTLPWLWRFHVVHHSAEEMDWLVAVRHHPVDLFLLRASSLGPLVALNLEPTAIAAFLAIFAWQSWLVHANVRIPYGPLRWVIVSPDFHHWHHSADREAFNKNYAALLSCWDVVFGSVHLPRNQFPTSYGVHTDVPPTLLARLAYPFRRTAA